MNHILLINDVDVAKKQIQDGRHLEFCQKWDFGLVNLVWCVHLHTNFEANMFIVDGGTAKKFKFNMAAAAILNFEKGNLWY